MAGSRRHLRLASGRQLWRLNEQGMLRVELVDGCFEPGGPPEGWEGIAYDEAKHLYRRTLAERWRGLPAYPVKGEAWRVVDGRVQSLGVTDEEGSRT